jgi:hypothetical protein
VFGEEKAKQYSRKPEPETKGIANNSTILSEYLFKENATKSKTLTGDDKMDLKSLTNLKAQMST